MFNYPLPEDLVARHPAEKRTHSRLLVVNRALRSISHDHFYNIGKYLRTGDLLVLNDTRVIPARLPGFRVPGGGKVEILLTRKKEPLLWEAMVRPGKKIRPGDRIVFKPKLLEAEIVQYLEPGYRLIRFFCKHPFEQVLQKLGHTPLPPYILKARRDDLNTDLAHIPWEQPQDRDRYQTVYAKQNGSIAAPTAGLHFSNELISALKSRGVQITFITLHVGPGTFKPVTEENIEDHVMHSETYTVLPQAAKLINRAKREKRRVIPVGTTVVRTLESCMDENGVLKSGTAETSLMILPGRRFGYADALVTNFHLPRSTLLMLVCAFGGKDLIFKAYKEAVEKKYRFYSYGDAMLIL